MSFRTLSSPCLLVLLTIILLGPAGALAAGNIEGFVSNKAAEGIPGATVTIDETAVQTTTGEWGYYLFDNLPEATYTLSASASGYATQEQTVEVKDSQTAQLDFTLNALSIDSAYPSLGILGQTLPIELGGGGFDSDTRLALMPDSGNVHSVVSRFSDDSLDMAVAVAVVGNLAYVISLWGGAPPNPGRLYILDLTNPTAPDLLNTGGLPLPGHPRDIVVLGDHAYITHGNTETEIEPPLLAGQGGLFVVGVGNPANPTIIPNSLFFNVAYGITTDGTSLYVVDGVCEAVAGPPAYPAGGNLHALDLANPASPSIAWSLPTPFDFCAYDVAVQGKLAYVANAWEGLKIIDIDPGSATFKATRFASPMYAMDARGVAVAGDKAFIAGEAKGLFVYHSPAAAPENTALASILVIPNLAQKVAVVDEVAYVASSFAGLYMVDVANSAAPVDLGVVDTPGSALDVQIQGKLAYVADDMRGLAIINVTNPEPPGYVGTSRNNSGTHDIIFDNNLVYLAEEDGLRILDVSDPFAPEQIDQIALNEGIAISLAKDGNTMYVAAYDGDLQIVDLATRAVQSVDIPDLVSQAWSVALNQDYIFVGDGECEIGTSGGLNLIDINDPTNTFLHERIELDGCVTDVKIVDTLAYVTVYDDDSDGYDDNGLKIIDVDPAVINAGLLTEKSFSSTGGNPKGLFVETDGTARYAHVADGWEGLKIFDVTDSQNPSQINEKEVFGHEAWDVKVIDGTAYVADYDAGVFVIDVGERSHPVIIGSVDTPGFAEAVAPDPNTLGRPIAHVADTGLTTVALPFEFTAGVKQAADSLINADLPSPVMEGHYMVRAFYSPPPPMTPGEPVPPPDMDDVLVGGVSFTNDTDLLTSKAIVVAGGGPSENLIWEETKAYANQAYANLLFQGFRHEDIYYLTDQLDAPGRDDEATTDKLRTAIETWAGTSDLLIFLVDHGDSEDFLVRSGASEERVSAAQLDGWLDTLQTAHPDGATLLLYDACKSGSFIARQSPPAGTTRITMASSMPEEVSYFLTDEHSFSAHFWSTFSGASGDRINLADAYNRAADAMAGYQTAQFDANGNGMPNEVEDGELLAGIESSIIALRRRYQNCGLDRPVIPSISDDLALTSGSSANLWARDVYDLDGDEILRVWAEILAPDFNPDETGDTVVEGDLPVVNLSLVGDNYVGAYADFSVNGTYVVSFHAEDEHGIVSMPRTMLVERTNGTSSIPPDGYEVDDSAAEAHVILVNGPTPENHSFHDSGDHDWALFHGIAGVVYKARAGDAGIISDPVVSIFREDGTTLEQSCNAKGAGEDEECVWTCPADGFYYLRITNASGHFGANVSYSLRLYNPIALEFPGYVSGYVTSGGSGISGTAIRAGSGSGVSGGGGAYIVSVPAGGVTVTANKAGYQSGSCSTSVSSGGSASCNIGLASNNLAPNISGSPQTNIKVGQFFSFTPTASDPNHDPLSFSIYGKPSWASFNSGNGNLSGTPGAGNVGSYPVTIRVTDTGGLFASLSFTLKVSVNLPPSIGGTPDSLVRPGEYYSFTPTASDPDGDPLSFSIIGRPVWASFNTGNGTLQGTPTSSHVGNNAITITVSDGVNSTPLSFDLRVIAGIPGVYLLLQD